MAIDYSKWDKLELSDDSDIEVHPNVDKKSFIRWKQQDIHQKREQRNNDIRNLEVQIPMYEELNRRVDQLLKDVDDDKLGDYSYIQEYLEKNFDPKSKPEGVEPDAPTHNEMIEDLFVQLKQNLEKAKQDPNSGENLKGEMLAHRKKIDEVLFNHTEKLRSLLKERELQISSDDIHTGWDRSFLNKSTPKSEPAAPSAATTTTTTTTTKPSATSSSTTKSESSSTVTSSSAAPQSNPQSTSTTVTTQQSIQQDEQIDDLHPDTAQYSHLPIRNIPQIKSFLKAHTHIITPSQKDALLMKAFDSQLEHNEQRTQQIIYLSTLLQYIRDVIEFRKVSHPNEIGIIIDQLLGKMFNDARNPALEAFEGEVSRTFIHIKQRCEVIQAERDDDGDGEGVEEIQLKSLDDSTELVVNLPDENSDDPEEIRKVEIFKTLPKDMQAALKTGQLDEVNNVFHGIPIDEAEKILEVLEECEVIGVQAVIENEQDWKEIKNEYDSRVNEEGDRTVDITPKIEELDVSDIVD